MDITQVITKYRRYLLVQPPMMLLLFALSISATVFTDLIVHRTCLVTLGINETECLILHNNSSSAEALRINQIVQPYTSFILTSKSFIESTWPSCLSLFLGQWSDKYGRKPLLISGYLGIFLTYFLLSVLSAWNISPWYLLIAYIPTAFLGGLSILMLGSICYITDITDNDERGWHLAWLDASINFGLLFGFLIGPKIFEMYGYSTVFSIATVSCSIAVLYIFLIPETIQSSNSGIYNIFDLTIVKNLINTCIKKREGFDRLLIWNCIACLTFLLIIIEGNLSIEYLFTSARLGWTVKEFSIYISINIVVGIFGMILGTKFFHNYLGFPEAIVAVISLISAAGAILVYAFTWKSWHMYLSLMIGIFSEMCRPMIRAILSKAVPSQDTGKVFSLATFIETLLPFVATSLYTYLYAHYMPPLYPVPVWFLSVVFYIMTIIILIYIQKRLVKSEVSHVSPLLEPNDSFTYNSL
ncbi:probable peptidoglycan muropeptide transporter SLC46 isoform X1 [Linepithema humile]|uniref:probable peptidoglycan muropeptide transporter SLC46 isoform X1 n=1 Tax=Linepithema humile TaxID=83485 RepID=UPI0006231951|nr:PREDICTED: proton-coupled folate transporter-like isoform X1 [Linepithema humile]